VTDRVAENASERSPTAVRIFLCLAIITLGLGLRQYGFGLGLPGLVVKYGGSILWAAMVFFLVALARPASSRRQIAAIAAVIAVAIELFRLIHTPWLDAFRLTLAGALLLGRIFSPWDILAYGIGILLGALLDRCALGLFKRPAA
jgi:uncharacterized protein DUF2809